ncbi:dienelactone hydrolase family protein [Rhodococcus sp. ARC_M6]|uniref:dienelactone hydrolase family protein n=1 Tax=Rhodococcus sp. ARC_M6 TaxID=2928852 RepID=UPI001FB3D264|nr:dienelactone hydrolase family protein [Rhodococcus sp. ARC_M6]MCJ0905848.1 dienelactone hydrolase family protein [Rhodococcus sp. ARC_M6]
MGTSKTTVADVPLTVSTPDPAVSLGKAVVVLQEAWGVNAHIESILTRLADAGYLAVAPHLYHRGSQTSFTDFPSAKEALMALNSKDISHDVGATAAYCKSEGADTIGSLGFCMGGTVSLWCAAEPLVDAAVTYYGGAVAESRWQGIPAGSELAAQLKVPWLGHYGDLDPSIPPECVEQLRSHASKLAQVYRYPDADHAFNNDTSSHYDPEAADLAWSRTMEFFAKTL